ncbi:hydrogenase [Sorangium cellulosum]|uniref:Hydrogenase n=1 Tax=Sorangium cellulosum TaxID=56 RepID=A0A4P2PZI3_SORCE|nr:BON domain-containing protein [Sorangium cellulosum]AUX21913.1 hydrogenase [Sorangium cellulosum]
MNTKLLLMMSLSLAAAAGCDRAEGTPRPGSDDTGAARESPATVPGEIAQRANNPTPAAADNTEKNDRDRDPTALTPGDQGESEADRTITQKIRQAVMDSDALSMNAKNVKIITQGQVVTLRGPVKSDKEKAEIAAIAQKIPGVKQVDNQLEVDVD